MSEARHTYHLHTQHDGSIKGRSWTNDDQDLGFPSKEAEWDVNYKNREEAMLRTGGTHVGISGCVVEVYLDGKQV